MREDKLLKKRQEKEETDGFYIRSRRECDQAFREYVKHSMLIIMSYCIKPLESV